ncbi:MAG: OB-fold domain-containing protein [bacterium]
MEGEKKRIPVREGLWAESASGARPRLIGSRCRSCAELFFPRKEIGLCGHCQSGELEEVELSTSGKIYSYTIVTQRPPVYYKGEVPYALGFVELPEGIRIETLFTGWDADALRVGMDAEMVIEKLHEDENGNEVTAYKFRPVKT